MNSGCKSVSVRGLTFGFNFLQMILPLFCSNQSNFSGKCWVGRKEGYFWCTLTSMVKPAGFQLTRGTISVYVHHLDGVLGCGFYPSFFVAREPQSFPEMPPGQNRYVCSPSQCPFPHRPWSSNYVTYCQPFNTFMEFKKFLSSIFSCFNGQNNLTQYFQKTSPLYSQWKVSNCADTQSKTWTPRFDCTTIPTSTLLWVLFFF